MPEEGFWETDQNPNFSNSHRGLIDDRPRLCADNNLRLASDVRGTLRQVMKPNRNGEYKCENTIMLVDSVKLSSLSQECSQKSPSVVLP